MTFIISNVFLAWKKRPDVFYLRNVYYLSCLCTKKNCYYLTHARKYKKIRKKNQFFWRRTSLPLTGARAGAFRDQNLTTAIIKILHCFMHNAHFYYRVRIAMVIIMTVIKIIIIYVTAIYARAENAGWRVSRVLMFIPTPTPPAPPPPVYSSSTYFPPTLPNRITICGATDGRHREFYDVQHRRRQHCAAADHIILL